MLLHQKFKTKKIGSPENEKLKLKSKIKISLKLQILNISYSVRHINEIGVMKQIMIYPYAKLPIE